MSEISKDFLRTERKALKLTQLDVAVMLSVSRFTYNKWESDVDTMPIGRYKELVRVFSQLREHKKLTQVKE